MKSGFVSILGRPNVGKSSLLNKILNYKLSIVSETPQTTRDQIKGIFNDEDSQIVFLDTPGIHKPQQKVGESYNEASYSALKDSDLVLFLSPIDEPLGPGDRMIIDKIGKYKKVALMTKLDKGDPDLAKAKAAELKAAGFEVVLGSSLMMNGSIDSLIEYIKEVLPEGQPYYDREDLTDKSLRFIVKEIIRESAIELTRDEIPHSLGIEITEFVDGDPIKVDATIFVERESQKGMIIGKNGSMIKKIGSTTRQKIKDSMGIKNILNLKVKVSKNWTKDAKMIRRLGY